MVATPTGPNGKHAVSLVEGEVRSAQEPAQIPLHQEVDKHACSKT